MKPLRVVYAIFTRVTNCALVRLRSTGGETPGAKARSKSESALWFILLPKSCAPTLIQNQQQNLILGTLVSAHNFLEAR